MWIFISTSACHCSYPEAKPWKLEECWGVEADSGIVCVIPEDRRALRAFQVCDVVCLAFHRDTDTLVGLPRPIHESVKTLKQVSSGDIRAREPLGKSDDQVLGMGRDFSARYIPFFFF